MDFTSNFGFFSYLIMTWTGIEPATLGLEVRCSTTKLPSLSNFQLNFKNFKGFGEKRGVPHMRICVHKSETEKN